MKHIDIATNGGTRFDQAWRHRPAGFATMAWPGVFAACLSGTFFLVGLIGPATALPKDRGGKCTCACQVSLSGGIVIDIRDYDSHGIACLAFNNKTCSLEDPQTGIIVTGRTNFCGANNGDNAGKITILSGQVSVGTSVIMRPMSVRPRQ